ncbi:hypothetical protein EBZ80_07795 [bacterium]|nr:hypothetical protein [bacterium]
MMTRGKTVLILATTLAPALFACSQEKIGNLVNGRREAPRIVRTVESQDANLSMMKVYLDLGTNGMTIRVYNIPKDTELFCAIDDREPAACHHGDRFERPVAGDHLMTVKARNNGKIVDSAITRFTVSPDATGEETIGSSDRLHPLALQVSNPGFKNGAAIPGSRAFTINFSFPQTPPCEKPVLRCAMDSTSGMWSLCDQRERRKVIPAALMASGAQSLFAQASCGDLTGPVLKVQWYGVPDNYQPLMAQSDSAEIAVGGYLSLSLIRDLDCASGAVLWECRVAGTQDSWDSCAPGGRLGGTAANRYDGFRAVCGDQRGPASSL